MSQPADPAQTTAPKRAKRSYVRTAIRLVVIAGLGAGIYAWSTREKIAYDFIADEFAKRGVQASYEVTEISAYRQVLTNIAIGDPDNPDLTVDRIEVLIQPRLGLPGLREIKLTRPRIFGSYREGQLSFGELDPLIFTGSDEPFEFPDLALSIVEGGGVIESDYGRIGLTLAGEGHLRGGFAAELAAVAPQLMAGDCAVDDASLYGEISISAERPRFSGPVRFAQLSCENGLSMADAGIDVEAQAERTLSDVLGTASLAIGRSSMADNAVGSVAGEARFSYRDGRVTSDFDVAARVISTQAARMASLEIDGALRAQADFSRFELEGDVEGVGVQPGALIGQSLASAESASSGTLLQPLLAKLHRNLGAELSGSSLSANFTARSEGDRQSLVVPQANLRGRSGSTVLGLSRVQLAVEGEALPFFDGNFATGGNGLPQLSGRMEQAGAGPLELHMRMPEYAAGDARLALPDLRVVQSRGGPISFTGRALATGAIPGGFVSGLEVPLDGAYAASGALTMWDGCRDISFVSLQIADLRLGRESLPVCPERGRPILRFANGTPDISASLPAMTISGDMAGSPFELATGPVRFAMPGALVTENVALALGEGDEPLRISLQDLTAEFGETISGRFAGTDVFLPAVPLDVLGAGGEWSYEDGVLALSNARFGLEDREAADRFKPVYARGASLRFADGVITAQALLRAPKTDAGLARVDIVHELATGTGFADLAVDGVTFTPELQPQDLSDLARGVVANVEGTVTGTGRIDWNPDAVTSSGAFASQSLDLAAAFGQVGQASGEVVFTDLLGLTTAPGQKIRLGSVNPGIEIFDGEVAFQLIGGEQLEFEGGRWPFLGGILTMQPLTMNIGVAETRTYAVSIEGLEASRFVEHMEMDNLAATGVFDGLIPIVFDENGNGELDGGILIARPPGGSLSYVGQLTYEDLSTMGNLAFQTLRDLKFDGAEILLDGPLTGELVTRVRFDGIGQGELAQQNIITRQVAKLPIRLLLNIRAPFYRLMTSTRSLYDPTALRDPRSLGLMADDGSRLRVSVDQDEVDAQDAAAEAEEQRLIEQAQGANSTPIAEPDIQPSESERVP